MATYMRRKAYYGTGDMPDVYTLRHDRCSDFDSQGFALPLGRCWVPIWTDDPATRARCQRCGESMFGREAPDAYVRTDR